MNMEQEKAIIDHMKEVFKIVGEDMAGPKTASDDGPDIRKARLVKALESSGTPIKGDSWRLFVNCLEMHLAYKNPDCGSPVDYLLNRLSTNTVNEGLVDHFLTMVVE